MTGNDVKNIIQEHLLNVFTDVRIFKDVHPAVSKEDNFERIVINVLGLNNSSWREGFANVNFFVPASELRGYSEPNGARMKEVEEMLDRCFKETLLFEKNDKTMLVRLDNIRQEEDRQTFSYFINVKLRLQITNF